MPVGGELVRMPVGGTVTLPPWYRRYSPI